jgi:AAA15 family ATPase/GTPase
MFIEFSVANFRSFKTLQTLSLQAANIVSKTTNKEVDENNVITVSPKLKLLKSKAIYGANASGKSNLIKAFFTFSSIIRTSIKDENVIQHYATEYKLSSETDNKPTFFQLIFTSKNEENKEVIYRYGFEVKDNKILTEWLFGTPNRVEVPFFVREGTEVEVNERFFKEAKKFENLAKKGDNEIFKPSSLFLSAVSVMGSSFARSILKRVDEISIVQSLEDLRMALFRKNKVQEDFIRQEILRYLKVADLGIEDIIVEENENVINELPDDLRNIIKEGSYKTAEMFLSKRNKYDKNNKKIGEVIEDFDEWESEGTKKYFRLIPMIVGVLARGYILLIDEFDARLHPLLTKKIIQLFNSNKTNPNNAQLIFVTHDASLLKANLLRRDQICFVEKDKFGSSTLKTLVEFKGTRNDASYEKEYLQGSYGAVPFLNNFESEFIKP